MTGDWRSRADLGGELPAEDHAVARAAVMEREIAEALTLDQELHLANVIARLQRVVTHPGSGDRRFIQDMRGTRPSSLTDPQRKWLIRLAWKYRFQLPPGLRPAENPDTPADVRKN